MHDVARLAGVSVASVSNYFHRPDKISEATRERIRLAMASAGFVPNAAARTLRTGVNFVVGYLAFELASARTPNIAAGIESRLAEHGMHLLMANDVGSPARELSYLQLFEQQRVAGVIVSPLGDVEPELARMRDRGVASVLSARRALSSQQASVSIDHVLGGSLAVGHLVEIGRRRIGLVTSPPGLRQIDDRLAGARSVVQETAGTSLEILQRRRAIDRAGTRMRHPPSAAARRRATRRTVLHQRPSRHRGHARSARRRDPGTAGDRTGRLRRHRVRDIDAHTADHHSHAAHDAGGGCRRFAARRNRPTRDAEGPPDHRSSGRIRARTRCSLVDDPLRDCLHHPA